IVPRPSAAGAGGGLEQDSQRKLMVAAPLQQLDGAVEVDLQARSEPGGRRGRIAGTLELLQAPALDPLVLCLLLDLDVRRSHPLFCSADLCDRISPNRVISR